MIPETENPQELTSEYPGKPVRHAQADPGGYFTQSPQCRFSRGTAHSAHILGGVHRWSPISEQCKFHITLGQWAVRLVSTVVTNVLMKGSCLIFLGAQEIMIKFHRKTFVVVNPFPHIDAF